MAEPVKPALPRVLGSGPLADSMRATIAADPDRYRPETWGMDPVNTCPCCDQEIFRCTTRHTGWRSGFASLANVVHPSYNAETREPDPDGILFSCCCVAPNWGPAHNAQNGDCEGLGPANDDPPEVRIEIRAAEIAASGADIAGGKWRSFHWYEGCGWDNAVADVDVTDPGHDHCDNGEPEDGPKHLAGFLARVIVEEPSDD